MITRVEISGFKTFTDFAVDLAPLSVIAGANASGKSNFLDALRVIQSMALGNTLAQSITGRGNVSALFTMYGDRQAVDKMSFAIEFLLPVKPSSGQQKSIPYCNRFRYELEILNGGDHNTYPIGKEHLERIGSEEDKWHPPYLTVDQRTELVHQPLTPGKPILHYKHPRPEEIISGQFKTSNHADEATRLSKLATSKNEEEAAVQHYFDNLFLVQLNASENFTNFNDHLTNNSLVLKELKQMVENRREDLRYLNSRVKEIATSIAKVDALIDEFNRVSLTAEDLHGARYLHNSLSEGTLRTIALAVLLYADPPQRTLLFEEPEKGIDPRVLRNFADLLRDFVINFAEDHTSLTQVICTTHSPAFVDLIINNETNGLAMAYLASVGGSILKAKGEKLQFQSTFIRPVIKEINSPVAGSRLERLTRHQANEYLQHGLHTTLTDG